MIDGFLHGQREGCHMGEKGRQQEINKRKEGLSFRQIVAQVWCNAWRTTKLSQDKRRSDEAFASYLAGRFEQLVGSFTHLLWDVRMRAAATLRSEHHEAKALAHGTHAAKQNAVATNHLLATTAAFMTTRSLRCLMTLVSAPGARPAARAGVCGPYLRPTF